MSLELQQRCIDLIERLDLGTAADVRCVEPLTGGVASDIAVVDFGDRKICAKFALEKLRVAGDWHAPVGRNAAEYAWLDVAGRAVPGAAPTLYGRDGDVNGFAMEFIQGKDIYLWKTALLQRRPICGEAGKVGRALGRIHAVSAATGFDASPFQNQSDFYDLRLEPYLEFVVGVHPHVSATLHNLIDEQEHTILALVHGDISPKNILFRAGEPVFLDAECATMGDPSFDVTFCLNHLIIKAFHMPDRVADLLCEIQRLWAEYAKQVNWEDPNVLLSRVCRLLPALMLARVDGKSPVEYLTRECCGQIREFALQHVVSPPTDLDAFCCEVSQSLEGNEIEHN